MATSPLGCHGLRGRDDEKTQGNGYAQRLVAGASVLVAVAHANNDSAVMADADPRRRHLSGHRLRNRHVRRTLGASAARVAGPLTRQCDPSLRLDCPWGRVADWCSRGRDALEALAR